MTDENSKSDLTEPISQPETVNKGGRPPGPNARDPLTGLALRQDGNYIESTGSGPNIKLKIIPPADMAELAKNGIAPYEIPNWDKEDPDSNWYLQYRKFTPERRQIFLTKLEQHGRIMLAARWAGVTKTTIDRHRKEDPEFNHACEESLAYYHEMCVAGITHQARVGMIDEKYDKEGKIISRRVSYEQQLRMMMIKRADPSYNDIQKQEVSVVGGAVVVPAPIDSVESWEDVVKRHTGGGSGALAGGDVGKLPSAEGSSAMAEGRVVKRTSVNGVQRTLIDGERSELPVVETEGESVVNKEPGSDSERIE